MASPFSRFVNGEPLEAVVQLYTDRIGPYFYVIGLLMVLGMIYYKTKNVTLVAMVDLIVAGSLAFSGLLNDEGSRIFLVIAVFGFGGALYSAFKGVRD